MRSIASAVSPISVLNQDPRLFPLYLYAAFPHQSEENGNQCPLQSDIGNKELSRKRADSLRIPAKIAMIKITTWQRDCERTKHSILFFK